MQGPLDHPHIVPVNSVAYPAEGELCGLSMPYWPGLSLDKLITALSPQPRGARPRKALVKMRQEPNSPARAIPCKPACSRVKRQPTRFRVSYLPRRRGDGWEWFPDRGTYA